MANLKDINSLPEVESTEGLKLIVSENGRAKHVDGDAYGAELAQRAKSHKELMYEWNFSADEDVYEVGENINEDLSWMTQYQDDVSVEIVAEIYAYEYYYNIDEQYDYNYRNLEEAIGISSSRCAPYSNYYVNVPVPSDNGEFISKNVFYEGLGAFDIQSEIPLDDTTMKCFRLAPYAQIFAYNGIQYDFDDFIPSYVDNGGSIVFYADNPIKSIKIYKVTK